MVLVKRKFKLNALATRFIRPIVFVGVIAQQDQLLTHSYSAMKFDLNQVLKIFPKLLSEITLLKQMDDALVCFTTKCAQRITGEGFDVRRHF